MRLKHYSDQNDRSIHDVSNYKNCGITIRYFYLMGRSIRSIRRFTERKYCQRLIDFYEIEYNESIFSVAKPGKALRTRHKYGRFNR